MPAVSVIVSASPEAFTPSLFDTESSTPVSESVRVPSSPSTTALAFAVVPLTVISSLFAPPAITLKPGPTVIFSLPPTASLSVLTTVLPSACTSSLPSSPST